MNTCACSGQYGIAAQLKTELHAKAIELGKLKPLDGKEIITESEQERIPWNCT
jgi:hypothetical protein